MFLLILTVLLVSGGGTGNHNPAPGAGTGNYPAPVAGTGNYPAPVDGTENQPSDGPKNNPADRDGTGHRIFPPAGTNNLFLNEQKQTYQGLDAETKARGNTTTTSNSPDGGRLGPKRRFARDTADRPEPVYETIFRPGMDCDFESTSCDWGLVPNQTIQKVGYF